MKISVKQARELGIAPPPFRDVQDRICKTKKRRRPPDGNTGGDKLFAAQCKAHGLPEPVEEYVFAPPRKWRFDYLFDDVALEIEGGVWIRGRHNRSVGFLGDLEKYNAAAILGYIVLRVTPEMVKSGEAFALVKRALESGE